MDAPDTLRRAVEAARAGQLESAVELLDRYIDLEEHRPIADLQEALELRARLTQSEDPEAAAVDRLAAQRLARRVREGER